MENAHSSDISSLGAFRKGSGPSYVTWLMCHPHWFTQDYPCKCHHSPTKLVLLYLFHRSRTETKHNLNNLYLNYYQKVPQTCYFLRVDWTLHGFRRPASPWWRDSQVLGHVKFYFLIHEWCLSAVSSHGRWEDLGVLFSHLWMLFSGDLPYPNALTS